MITVVMTTYFPDGEVGLARLNYAKQTLKSLIKNLQCELALRLHIADDSELGSPLAGELLASLGQQFAVVTYKNSDHQGIGASLNLAITSADDIWMYTTDDWLLTGKLNLDGPVALLETRDYDLVRLGPIHPNLECVSRFDQNIGWWLDIHQHYGGFAFATRPFIAKRAMFEKIGPFDECTNSYETERLYAERVSKSTARLAYWGGVDLAGPWEHIGDVNVGYKDI